MRARGAASPSVLYAVKQVELVVRAHLEDLLRASGVTTAQYVAMTVLARRNGLTSAELARNSFVTAQAMMELVNGLGRRGLIRRTPDSAHRRRLLISLTDKGRDLLAQYAEPVRELEERMLVGLNSKERRVLRELLNRCRAALATLR